MLLPQQIQYHKQIQTPGSLQVPSSILNRLHAEYNVFPSGVIQTKDTKVNTALKVLLVLMRAATFSPEGVVPTHVPTHKTTKEDTAAQ